MICVWPVNDFDVYATILAFDVKVEREAQEMADSVGVKIFQADIIYHLFDKFMAYREELKQKKREEFRSIAVFPCKLKILPQFIFNSRDPIVMGVMVENGIVKVGTPLCVPSKEPLPLPLPLPDSHLTQRNYSFLNYPHCASYPVGASLQLLRQ
ncbi:unnamed protein product [Ceratitis capitata]|uniref:(Mediterranean fruit fly) hypothetical protein n=1 Tax=Ceratitis capitata TaxID=7213 RepID=A0A811UWJ1_CERCA|nr:unnamed protein product [Ceratitis capitata]